ncbi:cytosolic sulfotransferase 13-like [Typha latifolia]|uniref:cytosolic sulfotransferase 13-like n=1 Tax=Typha latifolia TaxID=4733 RepID=UPI003C2BEB74
MTRNQTPLTQNPILSHHPHDCVVWMDGLFAAGHGDKLEFMPSPRILNTHMPYSTLPASVADCRIVYLCRDPKDIAVSMWKFMDKVKPSKAIKPLSFDEVYTMYFEGTSPYSPVWDHVLQYWRESLRRPEKVMFFRKGRVGDWKNYMSPEMAEKIDRVMKEKLQGSGLVL